MVRSEKVTMKLETCIIGEELFGGVVAKELPTSGNLESAALPYPFESIGGAWVSELGPFSRNVDEITPQECSLNVTPT